MIIDKEEYAKIFASYGLWDLVEDISDDGGGVLELTKSGEQMVEEIEEKIQKAYLEGRNKEYILHSTDNLKKE
jgi:hypothetical protein